MNNFSIVLIENAGEKNDGNVKVIFPHKQTKQAIFCEFPHD